MFFSYLFREPSREHAGVGGRLRIRSAARANATASDLPASRERPKPAFSATQAARVTGAQDREPTTRQYQGAES